MSKFINQAGVGIDRVDLKKVKYMCSLWESKRYVELVQIYSRIKGNDQSP